MSEYLLSIPKGYHSNMDILETEIAIKKLKDFFEKELSEALNLVRVSAPLFVLPESGLNDNLNGVERPVSFDILNQNRENAEIVHSLAKWKRYALKRYHISEGKGLYTDMNAIRRDEVTDNMHSLYVDQWDWEKVISKKQRTLEFLESTVNTIYSVFLKTASYIKKDYPFLKCNLPEKLTFVSTQKLEDIYPMLSPSEREKEIVKKYGAVFITQIGKKLKSGNKHDGRAPDYDDWELNGDLIFYNEILDCAFEISSMGIRVDENSLKHQLKEANCEERANLSFQKALLQGQLPLTIGGGIGQSRLCMFFLNKAHIGEVQSSVWPDEMHEECEKNGIYLL